MYTNRSVVENDFTKCVEISRRAWPSFSERASIYHLFCKHFSGSSFVVEKDGVVAGFLLGFLSQTKPEEAYIHLVAIDPPYQRQGLAASLYDEFLASARAAGRKSVSLIVNPDNAVSLSFHRKLGFVAAEASPGEGVEIDGVRAIRDYNGPGNHMVVFRRSI